MITPCNAAPRKLDEDGYVDNYNREEAEAYVFNLITAAFHGVED